MSRFLLVIFLLAATAGAVVAYKDPEQVARASDTVSDLLRKRTASAGRAVLESCFHDRTKIPAHLYEESARFDRTYPETLRVMRAVATFRGVRRSLTHHRGRRVRPR